MLSSILFINSLQEIEKNINNFILETEEDHIHSLLKSTELQLSHVLKTSRRNKIAIVRDKEGLVSIVKVVYSPLITPEESTCLQEMNHPNIVNIFGVYQVSNYYLLHLEFLRGECVVDMLLKSGGMSESVASLIFRQIVSAVQYLHSNNWVHRDLKPDNVMFDHETQTAKLIDFEFATKISKWNRLTEKVGTKLYESPEVRRKRYWGPEADVWSLGISLFVFVTAHFPFSSEQLEEGVEFLRFPSDLSLSLRNLISSMLETSSWKRISLKKIINHPWLNPTQSKIGLANLFRRSTSEKNRLIASFSSSHTPNREHSKDMNTHPRASDSVIRTLSSSESSSQIT